LLLLIPIAAGNLIYASWKGTDQFVQISKIVMLATSAFFVARYGFLMEYSKLSFVGIGLWITLLASVFVMFEKQVMDMINKQKSSGGTPPVN